MMQKWGTIYREKHGQSIGYTKTNSVSGVRELFQKRVAFACTDAFLTDTQLLEALGAGGPVIHVPLVMGAVVATYNLPPSVKGPLRFNGDHLANIYLGKITRWNDPALTQANPGAGLPDLPIRVIHRSDTSGTTSIWTDYLDQVSADWHKQVVPPVGTMVKWPVGTGAEKNDGVAKKVKETEGAIGYVELSFALQGELPVAKVKNEKTDDYVEPSLKTVTAAAGARLRQADFPNDLRFKFTNVGGEDSYPICGTTWAVLYQKQPGTDRTELIKFLRWAVHEGQDHVSQLHYAPLPTELVKKIDAQLDTVVPGP
jgi:phosphate transport system substrate-binding protein